MSAMWKGGEVGMTEQEKREKREKVIKGLGSCVEYFACKVKGVMFDEWLEESRKAIALLKAQEPRVMTIDDVKALKCDTVVYYEHLGVNKLRPRIVHQAYDDGIIFTDGGRWSFKADAYGEMFRLWSFCPTDEQRKMTPWETGTANGEK